MKEIEYIVEERHLNKILEIKALLEKANINDEHIVLDFGGTDRTTVRGMKCMF